jgi:hypothetical protein
LKEAKREDLIGNTPECLIRQHPPKMLSIRRSSQVKRLERQNAQDKKVKEERRQYYEEQRLEEERNRRPVRNMPQASPPRYDNKKR